MSHSVIATNAQIVPIQYGSNHDRREETTRQS